MTKPFASVVLELVAKLRDVDLSEFCNLCEGLNPEQVERIADDLEFAARNELEER